MNFLGRSIISSITWVLQRRPASEIQEPAQSDEEYAATEAEPELASLEELFAGGGMSSQVDGADLPDPADEEAPLAGSPVKSVRVSGNGESGVSINVSGSPGGSGLPGDFVAPGTTGSTPGPQGMQLGQPKESSGSVNVEQRISKTLEDIFEKEVETDPVTKGLVERHCEVDLQKLAGELSDFADEIGASRLRE